MWWAVNAYHRNFRNQCRKGSPPDSPSVGRTEGQQYRLDLALEQVRVLADRLGYRPTLKEMHLHLKRQEFWRVYNGLGRDMEHVMEVAGLADWPHKPPPIDAKGYVLRSRDQGGRRWWDPPQASVQVNGYARTSRFTRIA